MHKIAIKAGNKQLNGIWHESCKNSHQALIISHGFRGSMNGSSQAEVLAEQAADLGLHVIRYEFTPCQSLSCQVAELNSVLDFAEAQGMKDLILLGRSMGGAASIAVAAQRKVQALCLWATPSDLEETFRLALGNYYDLIASGETQIFTDEFGSVTLNPEFIQDFSCHAIVEYAIRLSAMPVLVLHGTNDQIVPLHQALKLYPLLKDPKELVLIEGGDHQFTEHVEQARAAVLYWLQNRLKAQAGE